MTGIPLVDTNDAGLITRAFNLGLKVVPNLPHILTLEQLEYWEKNLLGLKEALARGLILPTAEIQSSPAVIVRPPATFKTASTDLDTWLGKMKEFAKTYLKAEFDFGRFVIPAKLSWSSAIPIFVPGGITNRDAVRKALKSQGIAVYEDENVMKYSGSLASDKPTLCLIENSNRPTIGTLGLSSDQLVATGKNWLCLRDYTLAFGLHYFVPRQYLDSKTSTWFPGNRLSCNRVAYGNWDAVSFLLQFYWNNAAFPISDVGARLAIECPLKS